MRTLPASWLHRPVGRGATGARSRLLATLAALSSTPLGSIGLDELRTAKRLAVEQTWPHKLGVEDFLQRGGRLPSGGEGGGAGGVGAAAAPIIDVRAPCEYAKGHVPGAISVPLFTDDERAEVGTLYKQVGRDAAVERGLELVDAKGVERLLVEPLAAHGVQLAHGDDILVYCFRGGMRSGSIAWLLSQCEDDALGVHTLDGGYKRFRQWALDTWEECDRPVVIVGGPTGSGKTDVLHALRDDLGEQMLDLEGMANHRGSIFGALGRPPQPSNEHYENLLALEWRGFSSERPVYIEDESHNVGKCGVPRGLWHRMRAKEAQVMRLNVPHEARVAKLVSEYGVYPPSEIADCVRGLVKRLGHDQVNEMCAALEDHQPPKLAQVAETLLTDYYDSMYAYQAKKRAEEQSGGEEAVEVLCAGGNAIDNARALRDALIEATGCGN